MPFVTRERWQDKRWTTDVGPRGSRHVLWGVPAAVAIHEELEIQREGDPDGDDRALIGAGQVGRHYNLKGGDRLIWRAVEKADQAHPLAPWESTPGELDHLAEGGVRLSCLRLSRVPDEPLWKHRLTLPDDCALAYQPPLSAEEIKAGFVRPDAVVGSYAVFDGSGCKIAHILRPCAWSADRSKRVWGKISIVGGVSVVRFDRKALADLGAGLVLYGLDTFGYTSVGGSPQNVSPGNIWDSRFWTAGTGTITSFKLYAAGFVFGDASVTAGLWDAAGSEPNQARIAVSSAITVPNSSAGAWRTLSEAGSAVAGESTFMGVYGGNYFYIYIDSSSGHIIGGRTYGYSAGSMPDPYGYSTNGPYNNYALSLYVEYSAGGGSTELTPADATHGHAADAVGLDQTHGLTASDCLHGHAADAVAIGQQQQLAPTSAEHAVSSEAAALGQVHHIAPADAAHGHAADATAIVQQQQLAPTSAEHAVSSEAAALGQVHRLTADVATHAVLSEAAGLTQNHGLTPDATLHGHQAASPNLAVGSTLAPSSAAHAFPGEAAGMSQTHRLTPSRSSHAVAGEAPDLAQLHRMIAAACSHSHAADSPTLSRALARPVRTAAGDLFVTGQVAGSTFTTGPRAGDLFITGQVAGTVQ